MNGEGHGTVTEVVDFILLQPVFEGGSFVSSIEVGYRRLNEGLVDRGVSLSASQEREP